MGAVSFRACRPRQRIRHKREPIYAQAGRKQTSTYRGWQETDHEAGYKASLLWTDRGALDVHMSGLASTARFDRPLLCSLSTTAKKESIILSDALSPTILRYGQNGGRDHTNSRVGSKEVALSMDLCSNMCHYRGERNHASKSDNVLLFFCEFSSAFCAIGLLSNACVGRTGLTSPHISLSFVISRILDNVCPSGFACRLPCRPLRFWHCPSP